MFFLWKSFNIDMTQLQRFHEKNISAVEQKYGKKESPCGGWTPGPSEPKLGNVTTGLQECSLNSLETAYLHVKCRFN